MRGDIPAGCDQISLIYHVAPIAEIRDTIIDIAVSLTRTINEQFKIFWLRLIILFYMNDDIKKDASMPMGTRLCLQESFIQCIVPESIFLQIRKHLTLRLDNKALIIEDPF